MIDPNEYWILSEDRREEVDKLVGQLKVGFAFIIVCTVFFMFFLVIYLNLDNPAFQNQTTITGNVIEAEENLSASNRGLSFKDYFSFGVGAVIIAVIFMIIRLSNKMIKLKKEEEFYMG